MLRTIVHYSLHLLAPGVIALAFGKGRRRKAYWVMLATMAIDMDHLLATPIFDPDRMSVGFHPLHSWWLAAVYAVMCVLPYEKMGWKWWLRAVGIGLTLHILTDWQDYVLWKI